MSLLNKANVDTQQLLTDYFVMLTTSLLISAENVLGKSLSRLVLLRTGMGNFWQLQPLLKEIAPKKDFFVLSFC